VVVAPVVRCPIQHSCSSICHNERLARHPMNTQVALTRGYTATIHPEHLFTLVVNDGDAEHGHDEYSGLYGHTFPATIHQLKHLKEQIENCLSSS